MPTDGWTSIDSALPRRAGGADGARRRRRNRAQIAVMLLAMVLLLAYCGWFVAAWDGVVCAILAGTIALAAVRRLPVDAFLRAMDARLLSANEVPGLQAAVAALCAQAGLAPAPSLYAIDEDLPLAFSLGRGETAAIVVSDRLLSGLASRELRGVLAHEIIHLRNGDLLLNQIGLVARGLTRLLSQVGLLIVLAGVLLNVLSAARFALLSLLILAAAPIAVSLLGLALSRAREAEADLEAAELTGDPAGLASALVKIRLWQEWRMRQMFPGGRVLHLPTLFDDHPPTEERIRRLRRNSER